MKDLLPLFALGAMGFAVWHFRDKIFGSSQALASEGSVPEQGMGSKLEMNYRKRPMPGGAAVPEFGKDAGDTRKVSNEARQVLAERDFGIQSAVKKGAVIGRSGTLAAGVNPTTQTLIKVGAVKVASPGAPIKSVTSSTVASQPALALTSQPVSASKQISSVGKRRF